MKFIGKLRHLIVWQVWTIGLFCLGSIIVSGDCVSASTDISEEEAEKASNIVFIPVVLANNLRMPNFGFETNRIMFKGGELLDRGVALNVNWVRLGNRVSWEKLQRNSGDFIDWTQLDKFEDELIALKKADITPVVIVQKYPHWAVDYARLDHQLTSCGPLRKDAFDEFAEFMQALVNRYKVPPYDVHHWELGNEPDVDPDLLPVDSVFGCWGDISDPFYGGQHYGEMIKVVGQAIKAADPTATVWLGGLLLATPETTDPDLGKPELFFRGVLEAGAAPYFDVVGYHWYPPYLNRVVDHDLGEGKWADWGGGTIGKAWLLRQIMHDYGVEKPLFMNETGLMCVESSSYCNPAPIPAFFEMQADNLIRSFVRGLSADVEGFIWYTLDGPGWRHTGLLDENDEPYEAYYAYQHLAIQLGSARFIGVASYPPDLEAYVFQRGSEIVQVIWARENSVIPLKFPMAKFIAAYDRVGMPVVPAPIENYYEINIRFSPTFVLLNP